MLIWSTRILGEEKEPHALFRLAATTDNERLCKPQSEIICPLPHPPTKNKNKKTPGKMLIHL